MLRGPGRRNSKPGSNQDWKWAWEIKKLVTISPPHLTRHTEFSFLVRLQIYPCPFSRYGAFKVAHAIPVSARRANKYCTQQTRQPAHVLVGFPIVRRVRSSQHNKFHLPRVRMDFFGLASGRRSVCFLGQFAQLGHIERRHPTGDCSEEERRRGC
jgi:hypothetical protein